MKEKQFIILNSTILYVIAFLLTTLFHELGRALAGAHFGARPILHHNYVDYLSISQLSAKNKVCIALAGPLVSLLQGILAGWVFLKIKKQTLFKLFLLWFSILGLSNFLGYLMTGPLFQEGDIGKVYQLLNTPLVWQVVIAVAGAAILFYAAFQMTVPLLQFSYKPVWVSDAKSRKQFALNILIFPWLIGATLVTILYLPVIAIVSIIYPFSSGMIFIFPWKNAKRVHKIKCSKEVAIGKPSAVLYASLIVLIIVFRGVLAPGITI
jgi:hypothetical protein